MLNSSDKLIPITEGTDEAMDATAQSIVGFHHHLRHAVQTEFARAINSDASIVIVTRGKRFDQDTLDPKGRKHFVIDVAHLYDPARDPAMASHVGWVPGISRSLIKLSGFVNALKSIKDAVDACNCPYGILVVRCKSGRHRSVCAASAHTIKCFDMGIPLCWSTTNLPSGLAWNAEQHAALAATMTNVCRKSEAFCRKVRA